MRVRTTTIFLVSMAACGGDDGGDTGADTTDSTGAGSTADGGDDDAPSTNTEPDPTSDPDSTGGSDGPGTTDGSDGPDSTDDGSTGEPGGDAAFRFNTLHLMDPHLFIAGGLDITGTANTQFDDGLTMDNPKRPDGFLDLGLVLAFSPLDQAEGASGDLDFANAQCAAPDGLTCEIKPPSKPYPTTYTSSAAGPCGTIDVIHLNPDYEAPPLPSGNCFTTAATAIEVVTSSVTIPLDNAEVSAQYVGTGNLTSGVVRGFLTLEAAQKTILDSPPINGPLSDFLLEEDMDDDGAGWWMYLEFTALAVTWEG
jgi:hypothetical protein